MPRSVIRFSKYFHKLSTIEKLFPKYKYGSYDFNTIPGRVGCSDPFWTRYKSGHYMYFSFYRLLPWWREFVDDFNNKFNNIKLDVLREENPVFVTLFNPLYPERIKKPLILFIHHLMRMLSEEESWNYSNINFSKYLPKNLETKDYLDCICYLNNNSHDRYRTISENNVDKENILALDNLDVVKILKDFLEKTNRMFYSVKQTKLLEMIDFANISFNTNLPMYDFSEKDIGQKVIILPYYPKFSSIRDYKRKIGTETQILEKRNSRCYDNKYLLTLDGFSSFDLMFSEQVKVI